MILAKKKSLSEELITKYIDHLLIIILLYKVVFCKLKRNEQSESEKKNLRINFESTA